MGDHLVVVQSADLVADSGRTRYRVSCLTCGQVLHEATTAPDIRLREHLVGWCAYTRPMDAGELAHAARAREVIGGR